MTIYYCIYGFLFVLEVLMRLSQVDSYKRKSFIVFFGFITIFLMLALRHPSMGWDLRYESPYGYLGSFDKISNFSWSSIFRVEVQNYERGFIVFNKIISTIYNNQQFFLGVCAFLSVFPLIKMITSESEDAFFSICILIALPNFLMIYSGLRQALAIAICVYSYKFIKNKKLVKFIISVWFATFFHYSAFIFLVAYPLYNYKMKAQYRKFTVVLIAVVFLFKESLFVVFGKLFKEEVGVQDTGAGLLFLVFTLVYIFCIIYGNENDENQNGLMNIFLFTCICQTFSLVSDTAMRVGYYFMPFLAILLPEIFKSIDDKVTRQTFKAIVLSAFIAFGLYSIANSQFALSNPYHFFWEII